MNAWEALAACRSADPDIFFDEEDPEPAKAICASCPVRSECLEQCLEDEAHLPPTIPLFGVFGGTTPDERARMRHSTDRQESA